MELNKGFQQTDLGMYPIDWSLKTVEEFNPYVTSGSRGWASYYSESGDPFIRITNLTRGWIYLDLSDLRFVNLPSNSSEGLRTSLNENDILISITADIGIIGFVTENIPKPAYINQHISLVRFDSDSVYPKFISYFMVSSAVQKVFRALTDAGAKAGMNLTTVRQIKFMLPPTMKEQEAIANALSDADAYIESLANLISKKRLIKKGVIQEILTEKKRLAGYTKKWKETTLSEHATFFKGKGLPKSALSDGASYPCVHYGELFTHYNETITTIKSSTDSDLGSFLSQSNDVLMPTSDVTPRGLAKASCITLDDVILGGDILVIRPFKNLLGSFLSYVIRFSEPQILQLISGTTVFHIYATDMKKFKFSLPELSEQKEIVGILDDLERDIVALENKLQKAHLLKQGMMQELLTGRIRLV